MRIVILILLSFLSLSVALSNAQPLDRGIFSEVYEKVKDSVITLEVRGTALVNEKPIESNGTGSGVILDTEGHIVSNKHVIESALSQEGVEVTRKAREIFWVVTPNFKINVKVIGKTPDTDIIVLKADTSKLSFEPVPMKMGDSNQLKIGEHILAIGSPFGLSGTLTAGIVSSVRPTPMFPHPMIQTDAAINPGNSGGALVNMDGELVGVPTMLVSGSGTSSGIGLAIPSNVVKKVVSDIIENRQEKLGYMGITVQGVGELGLNQKKQLGIAADSGVMVTSFESEVIPGLALYDVITGINDAVISTKDDFEWLQRNLEPGETAIFRIVKRGQNAESELSIIVKSTPKK